MQYNNLNNYNLSQRNGKTRLFDYFIKQEQENRLQRRNLFLHAPTDYFRLIASSDILDMIKNMSKKLEIVRETFHKELPSINQLYWYEGLYTSLIENENSPLRVQQSMLSIKHHTMSKISRRNLENSLLETHRILMKDLHYAKPGLYRDVRVRVGNHIAPNPSFVYSLMDELFDFIYNNENGEIVTAAWAHIQFETIHPFIDGNGRTGRSLINNIFGLPIPLSRYIWNTREEYYHHLGQAKWNDYFEYFITGLDESLDFMIETMIDK